ncbi:IclR family transcriptional regulator [Mangrovicoccus sp. HB161399]|uniref:IclR family transcriptional regulator n=1 Tax=Mangrovicoccus sp. HB161399 TaxID=2720392 RepID=UPI0020A67307|nr:helix-turn-helix domain-containing protein [Mangrovicoccus sp. HB161399]
MRSLRKTGQVLRLFSAVAPEWSLTEIARELGVSTSGAFDLADGLTRIGLLQRVTRGRYRLGPLAATLGRVLNDSSALVAASRPVLEGLVADYGETGFVTVLDGGRLTVVESVEGTRALRVAADVLKGAMPLHETPTGMLHLAAAGEARQADYAVQHAEARPPMLPPGRRAEAYASMAAAGFAAGELARERDIAAVAASIRNHAGEAFAAVSLYVPRTRHEAQPRAFRTIVTEAAQRITAELCDGPSRKLPRPVAEYGEA